MSFLTSRTRTAPDGFGRPVRRVEDERLVTGRGRFNDDMSLPGQAFACFVRSPHAHARIGAIDAGAALAMEGVLAVLTGADAAADDLAPLPHRPVPTNPNEVPLGGIAGAPVFVAPHPPLPADRARFVGQAVAMVVAETAAGAADAALVVSVAWEPLPAVTATPDAVLPGAPLVWGEHASNVCVDSMAGDPAAADAAFARAAHVVRTTEISEVPSTTNALGLRGGGEGGTTPAVGAVVNAVVDALAELGVEHVEVPLTPERVLAAIRAARRPG